MQTDSTPFAGHVLVFDSGMGGLTVAREIKALAPNLRVDYAADNGFFPYGDKSDQALQDRVPTVAAALVDQVQPDIFVIACNTASTLALPAVRARIDIPVVGTVPAIKPAAALSHTKTIGLLATPGTVRRRYTAELIAEFADDCRVIMHGSVELVHLAEQHAAGIPVSLQAVRDAQAPLFQDAGAERIDTIVLACTHFPLIRGELAATVPHPVTFIDSGEAIARQTLRLLAEQRLEPSGVQPGTLYLTGTLQNATELVEVSRRFGINQSSEIIVP
ncbi:MAG: glutamate racemase [Pseudomonadota bacterium]